jgi:hypothetical protein
MEESRVLSPDPADEQSNAVRKPTLDAYLRSLKAWPSSSSLSTLHPAVDHCRASLHLASRDPSQLDATSSASFRVVPRSGGPADRLV